MKSLVAITCKRLIRIGILAIILYAGFTVYNIYSEVQIGDKTEKITIERGDSLSSTIEKFDQAKLLKSKNGLKLYLWIKGKNASIKAGGYEFTDTTNIPKIVQTITSGATTPEIKITILEGWNAEEIGEYLEEKTDIKQESWMHALNANYSDEYSFLKDIKNLEGYLFPDTYRIFKDADAQTIIDKMLSNMERQLTFIDESDHTKDYTLHEKITLASIIGKEVQSPEDKKIVAGIFYNRLENSMRIQSDATVNYITGKNTARPSYKDLEAVSPYNTYRNDGLPPGPIGNPGKDSIQAAFNPEDTKYFFFLTTPQGEVKYARNFDEHAENRRKYLE